MVGADYTEVRLGAGSILEETENSPIRSLRKFSSSRTKGKKNIKTKHYSTRRHMRITKTL